MGTVDGVLIVDERYGIVQGTPAGVVDGCPVVRLNAETPAHCLGVFEGQTAARIGWRDGLIEGRLPGQRPLPGSRLVDGIQAEPLRGSQIELGPVAGGFRLAGLLRPFQGVHQ